MCVQKYSQKFDLKFWVTFIIIYYLHWHLQLVAGSFREQDEDEEEEEKYGYRKCIKIWNLFSWLVTNWCDCRQQTPLELIDNNNIIIIHLLSSTTVEIDGRDRLAIVFNLLSYLRWLCGMVSLIVLICYQFIFNTRVNCQLLSFSLKNYTLFHIYSFVFLYVFYHHQEKKTSKCFKT